VRQRKDEGNIQQWHAGCRLAVVLRRRLGRDRLSREIWLSAYVIRVAAGMAAILLTYSMQQRPS